MIKFPITVLLVVSYFWKALSDYLCFNALGILLSAVVPHVTLLFLKLVCYSQILLTASSVCNAIISKSWIALQVNLFAHKMNSYLERFTIFEKDLVQLPSVFQANLLAVFIYLLRELQNFSLQPR